MNTMFCGRLPALRVFTLMMLTFAMGCSKQQPTNLRLKQLQDGVADLYEKYAQEISILQSADQKRAKKKLGDVIEDKKVALAWWRRLFRYNATSTAVPFSRYLCVLELDMKQARAMELEAKKLGNIPLQEKIKELRSFLFEVRDYVRHHKTYKQEIRYLRVLSAAAATMR